MSVSQLALNAQSREHASINTKSIDKLRRLCYSINTKLDTTNGERAMEPFLTYQETGFMYYVLLTIGCFCMGLLGFIAICSLIITCYKRLLIKQSSATIVNSNPPQDSFNDILYGFGLEDLCVDEGLALLELHANNTP